MYSTTDSGFGQPKTAWGSMTDTEKKQREKENIPPSGADQGQWRQVANSAANSATRPLQAFDQRYPIAHSQPAYPQYTSSNTMGQQAQPSTTALFTQQVAHQSAPQPEPQSHDDSFERSGTDVSQLQMPYNRFQPQHLSALIGMELADRYQPPVGGFGLDPRELYASMLERERLDIDECR